MWTETIKVTISNIQLKMHKSPMLRSR